MAKEVFKERNKPASFRVVFKVGLEQVFDVFRVGSQNTVIFTGTNEDGGVGWTPREDISAPV